MKNKVYEYEPDELVKEAAKMFKPGCSILDLGCGIGRDSIYLDLSGFNVTPVDISDKVIEDLKELAKKEKLRMKPMKVDVKIPSELSRLGNYDVIISMNLLQLLYKDYLDHLIYSMKMHTNLGGYNMIKTFTELECKEEDGTISKTVVRKSNEFNLRERYWDWSIEKYQEGWGNWESHEELKKEHKHYLLNLIAKNKLPLQLGYNGSRQK